MVLAVVLDGNILLVMDLRLNLIAANDIIKIVNNSLFNKRY